MEESGQQEIVVSDEGVEELAQLPLNGRQMKNILSISAAVASEKKEKLTMDFIHLAEKLTQTSVC